MRAKLLKGFLSKLAVAFDIFCVSLTGEFSPSAATARGSCGVQLMNRWENPYENRFMSENIYTKNICMEISVRKHLYENIFMKNIFKKTCPHTSNSSASSSFIASIKSSAKASSKASSSSIENAVFLIEKAVFFNRKCSVFQ